MADATAAAEVTFEQGYDELKSIVDRLDADEVTVNDMCELFARGKGLEQALREYLTTQQSKLDEIEAGEDLPRFAIVAPSAPVGQPAGEGGNPAEPDRADEFQPAPVGQSGSSGDDDIPF